MALVLCMRYLHYARPNAQVVHHRDFYDWNEAVIQGTNSHRLLRVGGGCIKRQNVFFLKIKKTGSTTVQQLLLRFGLVRDLSFMLFVNKWPYPSSTFTHLLLPEPSQSTGFDGRYNILCEHTVYSEPEVKKLMPNDTFYLANLRHPFTHIKSYINYRNMFTKLNISSTKHFLSELLLDPVRHDKANSTRNVMATFFGLPRAVSDPAAGDALIRLIDEKFDLVLIMERIDESLVLMKRRLCWTTKDILYLPLRVKEYEGKANGNEEDHDQLIARHQEWSSIDYAIYDHFARKLQVRRMKHSLLEHIVVNKLLTYLSSSCLSVAHKAQTRSSCILGRPCRCNLMEPITNYVCKKRGKSDRLHSAYMGGCTVWLISGNFFRCCQTIDKLYKMNDDIVVHKK